MLKLQIIGHLGQNAKINEVNGTKVINFSIADTQRFKGDDGQEKERTTWVNCQLWGDKIKMAEHLTKGRLVYVEGYPSIRTYQNQDNKTMAALNMRVTSIQFLGKNTSQSENNSEMPTVPEHEENVF